jgi:aldehyde:ferredoxin oxidoreductase
MLQEQLGGDRPWKISCIGPGGERVSLLAGIVNEKGRIAARSGVGAVMGSKRLKALAVRSAKGKRMSVADSAALKAVHKEYSQAIKNSPFHQGLTAAGTGGSVSFLLSIGDCPADNWKTTGTESLPTVANLDAANMDKYKLKSYACASCSIRCGALVHNEEGPFATEDEIHRPEYETLASFGTMCHVDSVEAVMKANEICNRIGIDTMGVGATVAFAMELWEKGLITGEDTGGVDLTWGNAESVVEMTRQIGNAEGFGAVLAMGSREAARRIGKGSEDYVMAVAGREIPYHDPRLSPVQGTHYICDSQPANHMGFQGGSMLEQGQALGEDPALQSDATEMYGEWEKKGDYYVRGNAYYQLLSSGGLCNLYAHFYCPPLVELMAPITGWDMTWEEGLKTGRRILTMRQLFNVKQGVKPDAFRLPKRFEESIAAGPAAGTSVPFEDLKVHYFRAIGWDPETGVPNQETLEDLGIADLA